MLLDLIAASPGLTFSIDIWFPMLMAALGLAVAWGVSKKGAEEAEKDRVAIKKELLHLESKQNDLEKQIFNLQIEMTRNYASKDEVRQINSDLRLGFDKISSQISDLRTSVSAMMGRYSNGDDPTIGGSKNR